MDLYGYFVSKEVKNAKLKTLKIISKVICQTEYIIHKERYNNIGAIKSLKHADGFYSPWQHCTEY